MKYLRGFCLAGIVSAAVSGLTAEPPQPFQFNSADLDQVLNVYQALIGRTVISSVRVHEKITLKGEVRMPNKKAIALIEKTLAEKGIGVRLSGDKFAFVARADELDRLSAIPEPPKADSIASEEVFPPGMIKFQDSDVLQVLDIYQEMTGRTVLRPQAIPHVNINVRLQTSAARKEAIWLLDALLFSQAGLVMTSEGEKFVFAIPRERNGVLPRFNPRSAAANSTKPLPAGAIKLQDADIRQLLQLYADLAGRKALPLDSHFPDAKFSFSLRNQQELSPAEAMFALEAVAALNNIRLELVDDDKVQMVPSAASRTRR